MAQGSARQDASATAGWQALASGRWEDARERFRHPVATEASADAWEGLGAAAWWLDDVDTVFGAREQSYRLYREAADALGAARIATALAHPVAVHPAERAESDPNLAINVRRCRCSRSPIALPPIFFALGPS